MRERESISLMSRDVSRDKQVTVGQQKSLDPDVHKPHPKKVEWGLNFSQIFIVTTRAIILSNR